MTSDANCIFCKIVRGEIAATKLHEDDELSFAYEFTFSPELAAEQEQSVETERKKSNI